MRQIIQIFLITTYVLGSIYLLYFKPFNFLKKQEYWQLYANIAAVLFMVMCAMVVAQTRNNRKTFPKKPFIIVGAMLTLLLVFRASGVLKDWIYDSFVISGKNTAVGKNVIISCIILLALFMVNSLKGVSRVPQLLMLFLFVWFIRAGYVYLSKSSSYIESRLVEEDEVLRLRKRTKKSMKNPTQTENESYSVLFSVFVEPPNSSNTTGSTILDFGPKIKYKDSESMCKIWIKHQYVDVSVLVEYQKWQKILITWSPLIKNIYVNGELKETHAHEDIYTTDAHNDYVWVGNNDLSALNGMIKDVCVFNKVLNSHEINDIF